MIDPANNALTKIVINNMEAEWGDSWVRSMCSPFGNVIDVEMPLRRSGKRKDICFVQFSKREECDAAVRALNGRRVNNRILSVEVLTEYRTKGNRVLESDSEDENIDLVSNLNLEPFAYVKVPRRTNEKSNRSIRPGTPPPRETPIPCPPPDEEPTEEVKKPQTKEPEKEKHIEKDRSTSKRRDDDEDDDRRSKKRERERHRYRESSPPRVKDRDHGHRSHREKRYH